MLLPGWVLHRYDSVASTMDAAARLAEAGARDRTAVISIAQTAGRGRGGRAWQAPAGSGLFCTLLIRPPVDPPRLSSLPLVTGVAVATAIERLTGLQVTLKWPNDVWLGDDSGRPKVAGILVTSRLAAARIDFVLVGIGINVSTSLADLPPGATSLRAVGCDVAVETLFAGVLAQFETVYRDYLSTSGRPSLDPWRARAALLGETVTIAEGTRRRRGAFVGVDDDGALLLRNPDASHSRIVAGDLVRGPWLASSPAVSGCDAKPASDSAGL